VSRGPLESRYRAQQDSDYHFSDKSSPWSPSPHRGIRFTDERIFDTIKYSRRADILANSTMMLSKRTLQRERMDGANDAGKANRREWEHRMNDGNEW